MKCSCGYEEVFEKYEDEYDKESVRTTNEKFITTTLIVTINEKQGEWDCDRLSSLPVFICPKCGTLKINIEEI